MIEPLELKLSREPFMPWITITLPDNSSYEFEIEEARAWLVAHGVPDIVVDKQLDYIWNFSKLDIVIANPKWPKEIAKSDDPRI